MADRNNNFQSISNFDVVNFAKEILNEVDQIRSYEPKEADEDTSLKEHRPIESRINAFFRLVGLPMFVDIESKDDNEESDGDLSGERNLTPGYFGGKFSSYIIQNTQKDEELSFALSKREFTLLERENKIGTQEMNDAMTQSLKISIPLSPDVEGIVGPSGNIFDYSEALPGQRKVFKKLFPLVTSYIKVAPVKNETARPFLKYTRDQMPDSQTTLPKPFIETVIRIRMVTAANAENSAGKNKIDDIIESIKSAIGEQSYSEIESETEYVLSSLESGGLLENLILNRLLLSLPQLAKKWYDLQKRQESLRQKSTYVISINTSSAQSNPFGKRSSVSTDLSLDPKSKYGMRLQILQKKLAKDQAIQMLLPSEDTILGSNTDASGATKNTVLMSLIAPFTKLLSPDLEQTQKEIREIEEIVKKDGQKMEALRLELEMMTGEFTGLSIIDVVTIVIALFALDKSDLIALLDRDTKDEMKKDAVLRSAIEAEGNPDGTSRAKEAVEKLEKTVKWAFDLLTLSIKTNIDRTSRPKSARNLPRKQVSPPSYDGEN